MDVEQRIRRNNRKKWIQSLAVLLFLIVLFWETESLRDAENRRIYQVYCIGDSITYGKGLKKEERLTASYPAKLQQMLGAGYEVINYGASGRTLMDIPERSYRDTGYFEMVKIQSPDVVVVMLGTNDSKKGLWDAAEYERQYLVLVEELKEIYTEPDIYLMAPPAAFPGTDGKIIYGISNDVIRDEMRGIVEKVAKETGAEFVDLYAVTEDHPEYYTDGVHLNREGYGVLAHTVYERIHEK